MSKLVLNGDTSGSVTLDAPAVSGTTTLTLPTTSGTVLTTATGQTLTSPVIAGTPTGVGVLTSDTAKTATSTSVDFTGIPSWVKRITVMFNGVSTSGTSNIQIQLGASSVTTSGYASTCSSGAGAVTTSSATTGHLASTQVGAACLFNGHVVFTNISSNIWVGSGLLLATGANQFAMSSSNIALGGTLDRIRITTVNGTDTFDAGSINILYE